VARTNQGKIIPCRVRAALTGIISRQTFLRVNKRLTGNAAANLNKYRPRESGGPGTPVRIFAALDSPTRVEPAGFGFRGNDEIFDRTLIAEFFSGRR
jgi:hypothetical protein